MNEDFKKLIRENEPGMETEEDEAHKMQLMGDTSSFSLNKTINSKVEQFLDQPIHEVVQSAKNKIFKT